MIRICLTLVFAPLLLPAQKDISLEEAIALSLERNPSVKAAQINTDREVAMKGTSIELPKTNVSLLYGQYNSVNKDNNLTITQQIPFPTMFSAQHKANKLQVDASRLQENITKAELAYEVRSTYNQLLFLQQNHFLLIRQDSLFTELLRIAELHYKTGEGTFLQVTSAQAQQMEVHHKVLRNSADYETTLRQLQVYCQSDSISGVVGDLKNVSLEFLPSEDLVNNNPVLQYARQEVEVKNQQKKVEGKKLYPDLLVGYFTQSLIGTQLVNGVEEYYDGSERFQGVQVGVAIPLFFNAPRARVKVASLSADQAEKQYEAYTLSVNQKYLSETQSLQKNKMSIDYYESSALKNADLLSAQSEKSFQHGELDYSTLLLNLRQALSIREGYLNALQDYNQSIIQLLLLTGK